MNKNNNNDNANNFDNTKIKKEDSTCDKSPLFDCNNQLSIHQKNRQNIAMKILADIIVKYDIKEAS